MNVPHNISNMCMLHMSLARQAQVVSCCVVDGHALQALPACQIQMGHVPRPVQTVREPDVHAMHLAFAWNRRCRAVASSSGSMAKASIAVMRVMCLRPPARSSSTTPMCFAAPLYVCSTSPYIVCGSR